MIPSSAVQRDTNDPVNSIDPNTIAAPPPATIKALPVFAASSARRIAAFIRVVQSRMMHALRSADPSIHIADDSIDSATIMERISRCASAGTYS
jgi:hypothetical protein